MSEAEADLGAVQRWMQEALIFPGQSSVAETSQFVAEPAHGSAMQRLSIYQRSYYDRLVTCMREQFPALCHALGQDLFEDFAVGYLRDNPPESYTLYDLGRRFVAYLEESRPDREVSSGQRQVWIDFMIDLARFERTIFVMFDAAGNEGKPFASTDVPDEQLALQPCIEICSFRFPVARYYHDVKAKLDPDFPAYRTSHYVLVRKDFITRTLEIPAWQYRFLSSLLLDGAHVLEALRMSAAEHSLDFTRLQREWHRPDGLRQQWLSLGFFVERVASKVG